jgi:hypothetical protein
MIIEIFDNTIHTGQLLNANGQLIRQLSMEYGINEFELNELEAGLYFIILHGSGGTIVQKVMKN